jgi:hypothetical protein
LSAQQQEEKSNQNTYGSWQAVHFSNSERMNPAVSGPDACPAGDGISNLVKYALLLDPKVSVDPVTMPRVTRENGRPRLKYVERILAEDIDYEVEISVDSKSWRAGGANVREIYRHSNRPQEDDVIVEFVPTESVKNAYLRLNVKRKTNTRQN